MEFRIWRRALWRALGGGCTGYGGNGAIPSLLQYGWFTDADYFYGGKNEVALL